MDLFGNETLRMLGWKQPFASLMLHGKIETRTWDTAYRGKVLMYSTKEGFEHSDLFGFCSDEILDRIFRTLEEEPTAELFGMAFAVGYLVHVRPMQPQDEERCFVNYDPARYCHIYKDVQRIDPFPIQGSQGFVNLHPTRPEHQFIIQQINQIA